LTEWVASAQPGSHPAGYEVAGVGYFTGGERTYGATEDILWYDASTGDVDEWKISGGGWAGNGHGSSISAPIPTAQDSGHR
jgi:hypothetical protein